MRFVAFYQEEPGDEPICVGPFDTEEQAEHAAQQWCGDVSPVIRALMNTAELLAYTENHDEDDEDEPARVRRPARRPAWVGWRCPDCSRTTVAVYHPDDEPCPEAEPAEKKEF